MSRSSLACLFNETTPQVLMSSATELFQEVASHPYLGLGSYGMTIVTFLGFFSCLLTDNVFQKERGDGQVDENAGYVIGGGDKRPGGHCWIYSQTLEGNGHQGTHQ